MRARGRPSHRALCALSDVDPFPDGVLGLAISLDPLLHASEEFGVGQLPEVFVLKLPGSVHRVATLRAMRAGLPAAAFFVARDA